MMFAKYSLMFAKYSLMPYNAAMRNCGGIILDAAYRNMFRTNSIEKEKDILCRKKACS